MSSTERLAGRGSGHSPKLRGADVYGLSPGTVSGNADLLGRTRQRALPNDKGALMCMASPRGTVSGNADLPGRTRQRALPAPDSSEGGKGFTFLA